VDAELGSKHVANEQSVGIKAVRWERAKLILPQPDESPGSHLVRNEAEWRNGITRYATIA